MALLLQRPVRPAPGPVPPAADRRPDTSPDRWPETTGSVGVFDVTSPFPAQKIGEILVALGALDAGTLDRVLSRQANAPSPPLGSVLLSEGVVSESALAAGLALQRGVWHARVTAQGLDLDLVHRFGADRCLRFGLVPWRRQRGKVIVATARPEEFAARRPELEQVFGPVRMAVADEGAIRSAVASRCAGRLADLAEARTDARLSVRGWSARDYALTIALMAGAAATAAALAPGATLTLSLGLGVLALALMTSLKAAALLAKARAVRPPPEPADLPAVSLLVPLLSEAEITGHLIGHLACLNYPAARLEVLLVIEEDDPDTARVLDSQGLPPNFRCISVPPGSIRTKPRALNYALDFATGEIVGVYDAEDAPEPDQIRHIAARFAAAPPEVVCLQGQLAFYNSKQNFLSRMFALDYASWFRVILPGLAKLGFAIPLGGTTVFFRRSALEALGRWDAHNVTEDADLGIRLARRGWRTEVVETTTLEEATCHPVAWVRQRTRWLKGYALTWAVHMRNPVRLWRELGPKRFAGFQVMFLGTVLLFLSAPVFWMLWLLPLWSGAVPGGTYSTHLVAAFVALFFVSELVNIAVAAVAVAPRKDRWLMKWAPALMLYFPLATIAAYRAMADIAIAPSFWDKTRHGHSRPTVRSRDGFRSSA